MRVLRTKHAAGSGVAGGKAALKEAAGAAEEGGQAEEASAELEQQQREEGLSALLARIMALEKENAGLQAANKQLVTAGAGSKGAAPAQQQQQVGLKPIKTHAGAADRGSGKQKGSGPLSRLGRDTGGSATSGPGTPAALGAPGRPARSSDGGGRRGGSGGDGAEQHGEEGAAGGGASYAPAAWEENKKLTAKVEVLRCAGLMLAGAQPVLALNEAILTSVANSYFHNETP